MKPQHIPYPRRYFAARLVALGNTILGRQTVVRSKHVGHVERCCRHGAQKHRVQWQHIKNPKHHDEDIEVVPHILPERKWGGSNIGTVGLASSRGGDAPNGKAGGACAWTCACVSVPDGLTLLSVCPCVSLFLSVWCHLVLPLVCVCVCVRACFHVPKLHNFELTLTSGLSQRTDRPNVHLVPPGPKAVHASPRKRRAMLSSCFQHVLNLNHALPKRTCATQHAQHYTNFLAALRKGSVVSYAVSYSLMQQA